MKNLLFLILVIISMNISAKNLGNIVEVENNKGESRYYYTLLPHEEVFEKGLISVAIAGLFKDVPADQEAMNYADFKANPEYIQFMHQVISQHAPYTESLIAEAKRQKEGVIVLIDHRVKNQDEGVPSEDIIGLFEVKNSQVKSYQANPNYVLWSAKGFCDLGPELTSILLGEIRKGFKQ